MSSSSPALKESAQAFFHGCCPNPMTRMSEPEEKPAVMKKKQSTSAVSRRSFVTATSSSFFPNTQFTNHESIPSLEEAFAQFTKAYPKYSDTNRIDRIRALEYPQLTISGHVCLDYIGVGLFTQSQAVSSRQSSKTLVESSDSSLPSKSSAHFAFFDVTFTPAGLKSRLLNGGDGSEMESCLRNKVMDFLNISQDEYSMVFTANRSAAFKLVAESYPFRTSRKLLTVYDHKNEATDAMIDESVRRGAKVMEAEFKWPRLRIHSAKLRKMVVGNSMHKYKAKKQRGLFVLPLQSRITGASYSYQWMTMAQENGWHVLLDACGLSPKDMDSFGLSLIRPDFVVCSFYKVFGENPTGFACLLIKKSITQTLEDTKGIGIVSIIAPGKNLLSFHEDSSTEIEPTGAVESSNNDRFSDSEQIIPEFRCLDHVDSLGLMLINSRDRFLINWLITALMKLQHPNRLENFPLVTIYGPKVKFDRGPALAFNICDWKGERVDPSMVQKLADRSNISLSNGYIRNVWFPEKKHELEEKRRSFAKQSEAPSKGRKDGDDDGVITVVTVALSFLADFEDVYRLWAFVAQFLDADFVEKERWRYTTLNEKTIEI